MSRFLPGNMLILDGKNWNRWSVQMHALFGFQDVLDIVKKGYNQLPKLATKNGLSKRINRKIIKHYFFSIMC